MSKKNNRRVRKTNQTTLPVPVETSLQLPPGTPIPMGLPSGSIITAQAQSTFSGPLPPPDILRQYNEVLPDAAERILKMAETQMAHRHQLENKVTTSDIWKSYLGISSAFIIAITAIVGGCLVTINGQQIGQQIAGGSIVSVGLGSLVWTFLKGTSSRREEREKRTEKMIGKK